MYELAKEIRSNFNSNCPVCKSGAFRSDHDPRTLAHLYICPTCGKFLLQDTVQMWLSNVSDAERRHFYKISFALRTMAERARGQRDNSYFPTYSNEDISRMLSETDPSVQEKLDMLLSWLANESESPGRTVSYDFVSDYSVICARDREESSFLARALQAQGLISPGNALNGASGLAYQVTVSGWVTIRTLATNGHKSADAFIAMWFSTLRAPFDEAISSAVTNAGYTPIRIDRVEHINRIDDEIIARIRRSKFLIADFTGQRNGVYFEAGFMLGLGRPVIWLCEKNDLSNVHFDARQYNTIDYVDATDLERRLQARIEAVIGRAS